MGRVGFGLAGLAVDWLFGMDWVSGGLALGWAGFGWSRPSGLQITGGFCDRLQPLRYLALQPNYLSG